MKIGSIGYNHVHDMKYENFIMDRPIGPGAVLLLLIKTPSVFRVGGVQYQVCLLNKSTSPRDYREASKN